MYTLYGVPKNITLKYTLMGVHVCGPYGPTYCVGVQKYIVSGHGWTI